MPDSMQDTERDDLAKGKRGQLDKAAAKQAGVPAPEELPNKAAVLDAIEHNPALAPVPDDEIERTWKVNAGVVNGQRAGGTFRAALTEQLGLLVDAGHISEVTDKSED